MSTLDLNTQGYKYFPNINRFTAGFMIVAIAVLFYAPSYDNEYALDDGIIIHQNSYVLQGIKGIKDILSKDAYHSFYERMNATDQLSGGRYRPVASISYAIEQQFIQPYRTGSYMFVEDVNHNGVLDDGAVLYRNARGEYNNTYEYNEYVDENKDHVAQPSECINCWDRNKNFKNDFSEDLNADGVFNEIDCQVYGAKLRHFNNIWLYALCCLLVYILFSGYFFRKNADLGLLSALIFAMHPVHSEVVANVRGRDDIFSLIFITLTFIQAFKYIELKKNIHLFLFALFGFLSLMSKEYAAMLFLLVPIALYIYSDEDLNMQSIWKPLGLCCIFFVSMIMIDYKGLYLLEDQFFTFMTFALLFSLVLSFVFRKSFEQKNTGALITSLGIAAMFYLALRANAVSFNVATPDTELLNNPFLLASDAQAFATKIYTLLVAFKIMVWPHPLISDYSYHSIPYRNLADVFVVFSLLLHLAIFAAGIYLTKKKNILGFALLSYILFILVTSNLLFPTHIAFLESFLFHTSLGFSIAAAWLLLKLLSLLNQNALQSKLIITTILILLLIPAGLKSWERSKDWKNDVTLFLKDVNNAPNSVLILGNAGARWIDLADTREITGIAIPGEDTTKFNDYNGTLHISEEEVRQSGYKDKREAALYKGIGYLKRAVELHPRYVNGFLNLGLAFFKVHDEKNCLLYWKLAERLYPNNPYLRNYYTVYGNILSQNAAGALQAQDYRTALNAYQKWTILLPKNSEAWYGLAAAYYKLGDLTRGEKCLVFARKLNPNEHWYQDFIQHSQYPAFNDHIMSGKSKDGC